MFDRFGLLDPVTRANLEQREMVDSQMSAAKHVAEGLRDLDPRLKLVFFTENAESRYDIVPGRWHVWLDNEAGGVDMYYPIQGDNDSYREPDWGVVEAMKMADMWSSSYDLPGDDYDAEQARLEKQRALKKEQAADEIASHFSAAMRVPGDGGMTKKLWGKK